MESTSTKLIIEFNGLPGCGKSTIAKYFESLCQKTEICKLHKKNGAIKLKKSMLYDFNVWRIFMVALLNIRTFKLERTKWNALYGLLVLYKEYADFQKSEDNIFLLDQGIVQKVLSIYHNDYLINNSFIKAFIKILESNKVEWISISVDCSIEVIIPRIIHRPDNGARVNRLKESSLEKVLAIQECNLNSIRKSFFNSNIVVDNIHVSSDINPDLNASRIFNQIV